jgi:hypothetical protein
MDLANVSVGNVRETVDAVAALKKNEMSVCELAARLALDKTLPVAYSRTQPSGAISST